MDYIYSRPRIRIIKFRFRKNKNRNKKNNNNKFKAFIFWYFLIATITFVIILKSVSPVFIELCREKALSKATLIINDTIRNEIKDYEYSYFMNICLDEYKNVKFIEARLVNINKFISNITSQIQKNLNNCQDDDIMISAGTFTGISLLAGRGPKIPIKISTVGNIKTNLDSEFKSAGINQTLHRLYLNIETEISILTPFNTINEKVRTTFLIGENIIIGDIPDTYYNLEGIERSNTVDIVE